MVTCPECSGQVEEMDGFYECMDCGERYDLSSTEDDPELMDDDLWGV